MNRFLRKIGCLFGNHHYNMAQTEFTLMKERERNSSYLVVSRCVDCGRSYAQYVTIPMPYWRVKSE